MTRRVLIVDDDAEDAALLESYLRDHGVQVEAALTEVEAREKLTEEPPAILIIDVGALSIDALQLLRQFHGMGAEDRAAIVACSGRRWIADGACYGLVDVEVH